ncbi:hypothetical protein BX666DRAFT_2021471 [Dichotomocladium elegans]|nr:hypothetical protein BX666DRAFT_2021471 [Dichotomocladium elegans]
MTALQDRLLLVFVHGFRGTDTTFKDFPSRLKAIASHTEDVHTIIYPRYKTAGDFQIAVRNLQYWVREQVAAQQSDMRSKDQGGKVLIAFLGHSMGGLVSAEVILEIKQRSPDFLGDAVIIGLIAYDTPFYSINHRFLSSTAATHIDTLTRHANKFMSPNTSSDSATSLARSAVAQITWPQANKATPSAPKGWGLLAGVVGAAAVGAAAYIAKDWIKAGVDDVFDHLEFVSTLMDFEGLNDR